LTEIQKGYLPNIPMYVYKTPGPRVKSCQYLGKGVGCKDIYPGVHKFSKTFKSHLNLLVDRRITWSKLHTEVTKLLVVTVKKFRRDGDFALGICVSCISRYI